MKNKLKEYMSKDYKFDRMTMFGILALIIVMSGLFGWIYEFIFYYFNSDMKEFYFRGGNFLPWINIYATGSLIICFLGFKHRKNPFKIFLISVIATGILEYIAGWGLYTFCNGFRCWDYNTEILNFGNINGFVCLRSVLFFGLSSLLLIYGMVPFCIFLATKLDRKTFLIISFSLCFIFLIDEIYNLVIAKLFSLPRASDVYKSIGFKYMEF